MLHLSYTVCIIILHNIIVAAKQTQLINEENRKLQEKYVCLRKAMVFVESVN